MATNNTFAKILTELRERTGKKRQEVADTLEISRASLEYYEKGKRKPDIEVLAKIADYYKVSTDYLLGIDDTPTNDKDLAFVCKYTGLNKEAVKKIVEMKKENTEYMNNGEFNANAFVDFNTANFINVFIANNELHYMSLLANEIILKNYLILSAYSSAIEKISKGKKVDFEKIENEIETATENKDLSLFRIQRAILNFFDDLTSDIQDKIKEAEKEFYKIKGLNNGYNP